MRSLRLITDSTLEPVGVPELRDHLKILSTSEDALLDLYIRAARKVCENKIKRALTVQTWQITLDAFPGSTDQIPLPRPPLSTVSTNVSITYVEDTTAGTSTSIGSTALTVDSASEPGRVFPSYGNEWPDDCREEPGDVTIQYVTGYATPTAVPEPIKAWIKLRAGFLYENRESLAVEKAGQGNAVIEFPRDFVDGLLDEYLISEVY